MEHYLIPWMIIVFKMLIIAGITCIVGALLEKYLPNSVKEKIVDFLKEDSDE